MCSNNATSSVSREVREQRFQCSWLSQLGMALPWCHYLSLLCTMVLINTARLGSAVPVIVGTDGVAQSTYQTRHDKVDPSLADPMTPPDRHELIPQAPKDVAQYDMFPFQDPHLENINKLLDAWSPDLSRLSNIEVADAHPLVPARQRDKGKGRCAPMAKTVTLRMPAGCHVDGQASVSLPVQACGGSCHSSVELRAVPASRPAGDVAFDDFMTPRCKCCTAKSTEVRVVTAECPEGPREFRVASATSCGCKRCRQQRY